MNVSEVAMTSFIMVDGAWPVARSLELIRNLKATHVIARRRGPRGGHLLFTKSEALHLLERSKKGTESTEALLAKASRVTRTLESGARVKDASQRYIVVEDGYVVGFIDPLYLPRLKRGGEDDGTQDGLTSEGVASSSLAAEFPEEIALGETASLLVFLNAGKAAAPALPLTLPRGAQVDVVIKVGRGLELEGRVEGQLVVSGEEETLPLQFKVKGVSLGHGYIRVFAFHEGRPLGSITLAPTVVEAGGGMTDRPLKLRRALRPAGGSTPDLSLLIIEETVNGNPTLRFLLSAADPSLRLHLKTFGTVRFNDSAGHNFQEFFREIENLAVGDAEEQAVATAKLERKGSFLFQSVIPKEMQKEIWRLRSRISSVWVESEEPWVPWELCRMSGDENGRVVEGPFFCEAFNITRWLPGLSPRPSFSLENVALIVPQDSGLPYAQAEQAYMLSLDNRERKVSLIPANFLDVCMTLSSGEYDCLHFVGHGIGNPDDPNKSQLMLEESVALTPEDLTGEVANLGLKQPFVFLNACQSGMMGMSLTDIGGWAKQFLAAGAGAFVGAYWSIQDQSAYEFARAFYDQLLLGKPVGEAAHEARAAIKLSGDPTWLAYTVFADPLATLQDGR